MEAKKSPPERRGTDRAEVIAVIMTKSLTGKGTDDDPYRIVRQYWALDGRLMWTDDSTASPVR